MGRPDRIDVMPLHELNVGFHLFLGNGVSPPVVKLVTVDSLKDNPLVV